MMMAWLILNLATVVICVILLAITIFIILHMINDRKNGKSSCGGGCAGCPSHGACHNINK